jgi:hypothetical protein
MAISQSAALRSHQLHPHIGSELCPWCDQPIPHDKFKEIQQKIAAKERERAAGIERALREQFARERSLAEASAKAALDKVRGEGAAALAKAKADAIAMEPAIRAAAKKAVQAELAPKITEAERAKKSLEQQLDGLKKSQGSVLAQRLLEQRNALEKANSAALNVEKSKAFKDKLKFEEKVQELQRQLQKKTADELGEGAEVDLFEALKAEFPADDITRVSRGAAGADVVHKVVHNGKICGCIIYDSKNRNAWRNEYLTKLRQDQLAAKADHSVLSTHVFPAGARQLHIQDGVVVANPARIVMLAQMLRKHVVQSHTLRLSNEARDAKTVRLYEFMTSDRCGQLLAEMVTLADGMLDLEVKEKKAHDATWKQRGGLIRSVQRAHSQFTKEIDQIIGTSAGGNQE